MPSGSIFCLIDDLARKHPINLGFESRLLSNVCQELNPSQVNLGVGEVNNRVSAQFVGEKSVPFRVLEKRRQVLMLGHFKVVILESYYFGPLVKSSCSCLHYIFR
jgi:hypothetical protein